MSLLIARVRLDPGQVSAGPRSRRRRTLHPGQRAGLHGLQRRGLIEHTFHQHAAEFEIPGEMPVGTPLSAFLR